MNLEGIEDLRSGYRRLRDQQFPTADVRSFVHDALAWTLDAPDVPARHDKLAEIIAAVPPRSYTGNDGLLVQVKDGTLKAYRGPHEIPLASLNCLNINGVYDLEYHPGGKAPAYAWIDSGDLGLSTVTRFLMNVPHLISPKLNIRNPRRQERHYAEGILSHAGENGHAYFGAVSITAPADVSVYQSPDFDPKKRLFEGHLGDVLKFAGRSGLLVASDVVVEEATEALWGVCGQKGRGSVHNLRVSQHRSGPYSLAMAAEQGGRLHLSGTIQSHGEKILQHAGDGWGMVTVFAPSSTLFLYVPERLTAIADRIFVDLGTNHRKKIELIARYIQREIHRGYRVEIEDRVLDWTEDGEPVYDHISVSYDPKDLEFPDALSIVTAEDLVALDPSLRFDETVAALKQKATVLHGSP